MQVVIALDQLPPQAALAIRSATYDFKPQRYEASHRTLQLRFGFTLGTHFHGPWPTPPQTSNRRKIQPTPSFQLLQQQTAFVILQTPVGTPPLQQLADRAGNLRPSHSLEIRAHLLDEVQFRLGKSATGKREAFRNLGLAILSCGTHQTTVVEPPAFVQQNLLIEWRSLTARD